MRLLLVEEDVELLELLLAMYQTAGLDADVLTTAADARVALCTTYYVALVLDIDLCGSDALPVIREIRARNAYLPILILTARTDIHDRVKGLRAGADDYLIKPFAAEELIARTQALLRRMPKESGKSLKLGNLELIPGSHVLINGEPRFLHLRSLSLLESLLLGQERVVPKAHMAGHLGTALSGVSGNAIEVYVCRLRKSLVDLGAEVLIETVSGVGYRLREKPGGSAPLMSSPVAYHGAPTGRRYRPGFITAEISGGSREAAD